MIKLNESNKELIINKVDELLPVQEKVDYAKLDLDIKELVSSFVMGLINDRNTTEEKIDYDNYIREFIENNIEAITNELVDKLKPVEKSHIEDLVEQLSESEVGKIVSNDEIDINPFKDIEERLENKVDEDLKDLIKYDPNKLEVADIKEEDEEKIFTLNL